MDIVMKAGYDAPINCGMNALAFTHEDGLGTDLESVMFNLGRPVIDNDRSEDEQFYDACMGEEE